MSKNNIYLVYTSYGYDSSTTIGVRYIPPEETTVIHKISVKNGEINYIIRKGTKNARFPKKRAWIRRIRPIRSHLKKLRERKMITIATYRKLYKKEKTELCRAAAMKGIANIAEKTADKQLNKDVLGMIIDALRGEDTIVKAVHTHRVHRRIVLADGLQDRIRIELCTEEDHAEFLPVDALYYVGRIEQPVEVQIAKLRRISDYGPIIQQREHHQTLHLFYFTSKLIDLLMIPVYIHYCSYPDTDNYKNNYIS